MFLCEVLIDQLVFVLMYCSVPPSLNLSFVLLGSEKSGKNYREDFLKLNQLGGLFDLAKFSLSAFGSFLTFFLRYVFIDHELPNYGSLAKYDPL